MLYVTPDKKEIYATNVASGTVSILQNVLTAADARQRNTAFRSKAPHGLDSNSHSGDQRLRSLRCLPRPAGIVDGECQDGKISIVDLATKRVAATIDAKVLGANRLKFTPDGRRVLISTLGSGDLVVYDALSRKEFKRVKIGHGGAGILMDTNTPRAFVSCTPDDYVAVIDLNKLEVIGHIDVGGRPDGLAWAFRP